MIVGDKNSLVKTLAPIAFLISSFLQISLANADAEPAQANVYDINPFRTPQPVVHTLINLQDPLYLSGSYVNVIDSKYCNGCEHSYAVRDPNAGFIYNPGDPRFAEAMAYYQIDQYRNYIVNSIGISLPALPITVDAHKVDANGYDIAGASYTPPPLFFGTWPGTIAVGDKNRIDTNGDWIADTDVPNIEMALNADVLVHEYGHAVTDYLRSGSYSALPKFMQEGWADYLMCSRLGSPLVGDWTDRNGFRGFRRTLVGGISRLDLWPTNNIRAADGISNADYNTARIYYNSMVWSGPLWELRERIARLAGYDYTVGSVLTDRLVLTAIPLFQVAGQSDSNPTAAITEGVRSLKQALAQLKPLYPDYQNVTDTDIDLAFSAQFPKESGTSQDVSADERKKAWAHQTGRKDISIAVIDSGLAQEIFFPVMKDTSTAFASEDKNLNGVLDSGEDTNGNGILDRGNIAFGWNFVNGNSSPVDGNNFGGSHGTTVALGLAAAANNGEAHLGMIWNTSLWVLKKSDSVQTVPFSAVNQHTGEAHRYASDNKADIVNISAGVFSETGALSPAVDAFHMPTFNAIQEGVRVNDGQDKDTIVVAAVGNNGWDNDVNPVYPASYPLPNVIAVTTSNGTNNYGKYNVDLAANAGTTSFAAPLVSGAIGLLLSEQKDRQEAHPGYRSLTTGEIKYLLLMSTDHVQALEGKAVSEGQLNVRRLLEYYETDADWDGYSDKIESLFGMNPNDPNSHPNLIDGDDDGDGLTNHLELAYGTIPIPVNPGVNYSGMFYPVYLDANGAIKAGVSAQDSDGDGIGELAETRVANGYYTDPANPDTDGDGIPDGQDTNPSLFKATVSNTLALKKTTTASDSYVWWVPAGATDGNSGSWWQTTNSGGSHWLTVDLGAEARVHETRFLFDTDYSVASDYTLQFSLNGNFSDPATREVHVTGNTLRDRKDTFVAPIRARYVRFLITAPSAAGNFFRVKEFEVHGAMPTNIAISKAATASDDFYGIWKAQNAVDGNSASYWQTASGVSSPHWLQVDLGTAASISSIVTHYDSGYNFASDYTLQFSNTGDFSATGSGAPYELHVTNNNSRDPANVFYNPVKARYVRLLINQPTSGFFRVKELEIIGVTP